MSYIKDQIHDAADELGRYAKSEEARGEAWVRGKLNDIDVYLRGLWSKPVALGAVVAAASNIAGVLLIFCYLVVAPGTALILYHRLAGVLALSVANDALRCRRRAALLARPHDGTAITAARSSRFAITLAG